MNQSLEVDIATYRRIGISILSRGYFFYGVIETDPGTGSSILGQAGVCNCTYGYRG